MNNYIEIFANNIYKLENRKMLQSEQNLNDLEQSLLNDDDAPFHIQQSSGCSLLPYTTRNPYIWFYIVIFLSFVGVLVMIFFYK